MATVPVCIYYDYFFYSEAEILRHKENNKKFYDNFVVLSADYISTCTNKCEYNRSFLLLVRSPDFEITGKETFCSAGTKTKAS
jgi:hypothetical protein